MVCPSFPETQFLHYIYILQICHKEGAHPCKDPTQSLINNNHANFHQCSFSLSEYVSHIPRYIWETMVCLAHFLFENLILWPCVWQILASLFFSPKAHSLIQSFIPRLSHSLNYWLIKSLLCTKHFIGCQWWTKQPSWFLESTGRASHQRNAHVNNYFQSLADLVIR